MDKCAKCGRKDDGWLAASVDINDLLCINCLDRFSEWCETHPGEPFSNFIQPKPWQPKNPGLLTFEIDGKMTTVVPINDFEVREMYKYELLEQEYVEDYLQDLLDSMMECF